MNANRTPSSGARFVCLSIGIIAWNEEKAIERMLRSLFGQTLFAELAARDLGAEIVCVANGCSDATGAVAARVFDEAARVHPYARAFRARVENLAERGKINAWNQFVHALSARPAGYLILLDADIVIHNPRTLWNLVAALERDPAAHIAVDQPCKDIAFKPNRSLRERLSLAASRLTSGAAAQLCAQLYCIRADIARRVYLPRDLAACDDGFIKTLVCTDFLQHAVVPERITAVADAAHTFEAYTTLRGLWNNQKRQAIGQALVHLIIDHDLARLPAAERERAGDILRLRDRTDPDWLKRLVAGHLRRRPLFWRLFPGVWSRRFRGLGSLRGREVIPGVMAALAGGFMAMLASFRAWRFLRAGSLAYWPRPVRSGMSLRAGSGGAAQERFG